LAQGLIPVPVPPPRSRPRPTSVAAFLALSGIAVVTMIVGSGFFPGDQAGAHLGRLFCSIAALALLIAGSRQLLQRDQLAPDRLGLGFTAAHGKAFLWGVAIACALILVLLGGFYLLAPFGLLRGSLPLAALPAATLDYLVGNSGEELLFRGYLLIALAQWMGTTRALWALAVPFGLFHFPGLDAVALIKMMLTTGAMHFVFAYVYLATRSLWASISLHGISNALLHSVVGTGKPAVLSIHFHRELPDSVDGPFLVFFGTALAFALALSRLPQVKRGSAWLESAGSR